MSERDDLIRDVRESMQDDMANEVAIRTRVNAEPLLGDPTLGLGFALDLSSILKLVLPILAPLLVPMLMPMISSWTGVDYTGDTIAFITTTMAALITAITTGNITTRAFRVNNERNSRLREAELLQQRDEFNKDHDLQRSIVRLKEDQLTLDREVFAASKAIGSDEPTASEPTTKAA